MRRDGDKVFFMLYYLIIPLMMQKGFKKKLKNYTKKDHRWFIMGRRFGMLLVRMMKYPKSEIMFENVSKKLFQ
jgi:hypothetical protein